MATGITISSTSNLTDGQKIVIANAKMANEPAAPDPDLVGLEPIGQGEKQVNVGTYARLANADALTEGADLSAVQQMVMANITLTPIEKGIIVTLSKPAMRRQGDGQNLRARAGVLLGGSLRRKLAVDVIGNYDNFSKSSPGISATLDITTFRGGVAYLLTDNDSAFGPAPMPLHASLHIEQISDIILDISDAGARISELSAGFSADLVKNWWKGRDRLYSVQVFHGGNIPRDSAGDSKGAIFNRDALVLCLANQADPTEQADESARVVEYGIFQEWDTTERADSHGLEIYSDSNSTL